MADYNEPKLATIGQFRFWCQKVLPAVYDDSLSYYELLCKVIKKLNDLISVDNEQSKAIVELANQLQELKELFDKFIESGFDDYYKEEVEKWIADNLEFIYAHTIKQIYFGLDDIGHVVAFIPESWDDITFDTIMDFASPNYGCLTLSY